MNRIKRIGVVFLCYMMISVSSVMASEKEIDVIINDKKVESEQGYIAIEQLKKVGLSIEKETAQRIYRLDISESKKKLQQNKRKDYPNNAKENLLSEYRFLIGEEEFPCYKIKGKDAVSILDLLEKGYGVYWEEKQMVFIAFGKEYEDNLFIIKSEFLETETKYPQENNKKTLGDIQEIISIRFPFQTKNLFSSQKIIEQAENFIRNHSEENFSIEDFAVTMEQNYIIFTNWVGGKNSKGYCYIITLKNGQADCLELKNSADWKKQPQYTLSSDYLKLLEYDKKRGENKLANQKVWLGYQAQTDGFCILVSTDYIPFSVEERKESELLEEGSRTIGRYLLRKI